jgi:site-specific DNA recombinase
MRAAIYLRVSTEEQVTGYGLDVQRERCRAMATVKGWSVIAEYADEGISGTKDAVDRPQLAALLHACIAGELDAVIVLALDRLGRKTRLVLELVDRLTVLRVTLVSCKESLDTSTPQGQFVLTMFAALAQLERDTIVERTTAGRNQRGKHDGEKGGRLPYGYVRTLTGVQVEDHAAPIVRRIFAERAAGATLSEIATHLNTLATASPRGSRWYASGVRDVLNNESAYRGGTRGASGVHWPAIL